MHKFVLQDWVTIRGNYTIGVVTQSAHQWLDLEDYEDLTAWIDVREVTFPTGTSTIYINLQTAPIKDEVLFMTMTSGLGITAPLTTPSIQKVILAQSPTVPLGRWVRWQLTQSGSTAGTWDMTFRILVAAIEMKSMVNANGGGKRGQKSSVTSMK